MVDERIYYMDYHIDKQDIVDTCTCYKNFVDSMPRLCMIANNL